MVFELRAIPLPSEQRIEAHKALIRVYEIVLCSQVQDIVSEGTAPAPTPEPQETEKPRTEQEDGELARRIRDAKDKNLAKLMGLS